MEGHEARFTYMFGSFYNNVSPASLSLDNNLTLTSELMGHVDGTLHDFARNKLLSLFKGRARATIIRKY